MMDADMLKRLKMACREAEAPYFTDDDIEFWYNECKGDFKETVYRLLIMKSENTEINVSGLKTADTSKYFRRLAAQYRPSHTGTLK